jgi:cellulose synthase (UDP-forming)
MFKLLPTVVATLAKPFGHTFKVTPKGSAAAGAGYDRRVFWTAATLMGLTAAGIIVNTVPEWRIVGQLSLLPMVALWSAINIIVLFLVCMLSLQAPIRRAEERFEIDEPLWIIGSSGTILNGRIRNISLSGLAFSVDQPVNHESGQRLRVFITEVGFVAGTVMRGRKESVGIRFDLPPSLERDLLIRKLFTGGHNTTSPKASAWSVTAAMLKTIWGAQTEAPVIAPQHNQTAIPIPPVEKLPAQTLVLSPQRQKVRLSDLVETRRGLAA